MPCSYEAMRLTQYSHENTRALGSSLRTPPRVELHRTATIWQHHGGHRQRVERDRIQRTAGAYSYGTRPTPRPQPTFPALVHDQYSYPLRVCYNTRSYHSCNPNALNLFNKIELNNHSINSDTPTAHLRASANSCWRSATGSEQAHP